MRVEVGDDDDVVLACLRAAQDHFESATGTFLTPRQLTAFEYGWPADGFRVVAFPTIAARVFYEARDLGEVQVSPGDLMLRRDGGPALLVPAAGGRWPDDWVPDSEIRLEVNCGFPLGAAPDGAVHAVRFLLAHFYKQREAVAVGQMAVVPMAAEALMAPWRQLWVA